MRGLGFEWDDRKNSLNKRKHKVSFEEGATVFVDENALLLPDPDHSIEEDRFLLLGLSSTLRILIVCHCYRQGESTIRIINARKASKHEKANYIKGVKL